MADNGNMKKKRFSITRTKYNTDTHLHYYGFECDIFCGRKIRVTKWYENIWNYMHWNLI